MTKKQRKLLGRILTAAVLMLILHFIPAGGHLQFLLYLIPYLVIGHDILKKAWKGIKNKRIFDENFLMATATIGAMIIGLAKTGDYVEGIAVMLFYQIGELFQSYAVGKSRKSITALMDIRPDYANVMANGKLTQVDPTEVAVGTIIVVQPGEKIPIDGTVLDGTSSLNTSALTGESLPRDVRKGDAVISGCINMTGILKIRTTKVFGESTVSKVLDLVENASSLKSKSEAFISKFSRVYTPVVCFSALALAVIPPAVSLFLPGVDPNWSEWIYRALSFLVASCPCALVISIPLTFFASIGGASAQGILVKGSNYLEALAKTGYVVFDKTGTLTQGVFQVKAVCPVTSRYVQEQLLEYAAYAECASSHPISKSLLQAYGKAVDRSRIADIQEISGNGVVATVDGKNIAVGNNKLMQTLCIHYCETDLAGTVVHIAIGGEYAGYIVISDMLKPTAKAALSALKTAGIQKTVMLTGDSQKVAEPAAQELGVDAVFADLLPCDKVSKLEMLLAEKPKDKNLVFVGDGINDAPVLSRADVGIAMGGIGSDAAIEAADIVLMDDDPMKIVKAIKIARKCMGIVKQNTAFAIGIKLLVLILVALGFSNMWAAVFADVGVMVLAVLNAIRALFVKNL